MSLDQTSTTRNTSRSQRYWTSLKWAYRTFNNATHHTLGALFRLVVVAYFIFCVLFLALRYLVLPNIDHFRDDIERLASQAVGNRVTISAVQASWSGLRPRLALGDVVIHDGQGKQALHLPQVSATLSWWTLAAASLRLESLELTRPDLDLLRDINGNFYVAGLLVDMDKKADSRGADWVLSQREIIIRGGTVRWTDQQRQAPPLVLNDVTLALRNQWRSHQFALKAAPPPAYAAPIDVRAAFTHAPFARSISDPSRWKGELYADVPSADLAVWRAYLDYPIEIREGKGSIRGWVKFDRARIADVTADLALANVAARLGENLEQVSLVHAKGRMSYKEDVRRQMENRAAGSRTRTITLADFSLETQDGLVLPSTDLTVRRVQPGSGRPEKTEIAAASLDLQTLADLGARLPLPEEQRKLLREVAPRGMLRDVAGHWEGELANPESYEVRGDFEGLALKPRVPAPEARSSKTAGLAATPGFENLNGRVQASDKGGSLVVTASNAKLHLPAYLREPTLPFARLALEASWSRQPGNQLLVDLRKLDFLQEGIAGAFTGRHVLPLKAGSPGVIDLSGRVKRVHLQQVGRYLPLQTPETLHAWLAGALAGGTAEDVKIRVKGDLAQFPFAGTQGEKPKGEFSVTGKIRGGKLNYVPGHFAQDGKAPLWPLLEEVNGLISFDRGRLEIQGESARTRGIALSKLRAVLDDVTKGDLLLAVEGEAAAQLQDFVRFVNDSPVDLWIARFTRETKASGPARLGLKLQLPLAHLADAKVQGTLHFANNTIALQGAIPVLSGVQGRLEFHEEGFNLNRVRAEFLGGQSVLSGGMRGEGGILVRAEGTVSADGIQQAYPTPASQRLFQRIRGTTRYGASIRVRNKQPEISIESSLAGIELDFPAPLRKAADQTLPLKFELTGVQSDDPRTIRDEFKIALGPAMSARYMRQKSTAAQAAWRVVRGGIGVNAPAPEPDSGLIANVDLQTLNIDAWRSVASSIVATSDKDGPAVASQSPGLAQYILPDVLAARATELLVMGKKLDNVVVGASQQNGVWQANIDSEQASGYATWSQADAETGPGRVTARLASLIIPKSSASDVSELLEGKSSTSEIPGLDIVAEDFQLFGKKFGHLELVADNVGASSRREWRINRLLISNPDGELRALGKWASGEEAGLTNLKYTLQIADAGRLLDRFGFQDIIRGGTGKMEGEVSWRGMPYSLDVPSLSGRLQLDVAAGQFLKVDPSAAKLLGVLNLQSLPRRLALDFRDVFSEGFAFDGVTASATITRGVAHTDNFKMRGVAATVLIDGTADIAKETQDLHVAVIPEINVGAASVVYALAVNPVIGVGTFLAQLFLREPLMKAFTFEYRITGPWKDPVVMKLARIPGTPIGLAPNDHSAYTG